MKSILLTSTALVAFAGAAAAEVTFGGSTNLKYNSNDGFSSDATLDLTMSQALDNGLTESATISINREDKGDQALTATDYVLSLSSDTASLSYGAVDPVAAAAWSGVDGSVLGDFDKSTAKDAILTGSATFGETKASISYGVDLTASKLNEMQVGITSTVGAATVALAYQNTEHDGHDDVTDADNSYQAGALLGLSVGSSFGGADVKLAYLTDMADNSSFGVDVAYPVGPVTVGGYYTANAEADGKFGVRAGYTVGAMAVNAAFTSDKDFSLEGSYEVGNGVTAYAGVVDAGNDYYIGVAYDMGNGASATLSHVKDGGTQNASNEIGANDYARGTAIGLSFTF